ncbi:MAG: hypothetical protein CMK59_13725 [Proteobacteria bacterium]|nr:hypothetical protein [Pseudomonadota bacterium]
MNILLLGALAFAQKRVMLLDIINLDRPDIEERLFTDELRAGAAVALQSAGDDYQEIRPVQGAILAERSMPGQEDALEAEWNADFVLKGEISQKGDLIELHLELQNRKKMILLERTVLDTEIELHRILPWVSWQLLTEGLEIEDPIIPEAFVEFFTQNKPQKVLIESVPPGARLKIDERLKCDETPCILEIERGEHTFELTRRGFDVLKYDRVISDHQKLLFTLNPLKGQALIITEPPGVDLFIDGQDMGQTPYFGDLIVGEHQFELKSDCYQSKLSSFEMNEHFGSTVEVKLTPKFKQIVFDSEVAGLLHYKENPYPVSIGKDPVELPLCTDQVFLQNDENGWLQLYLDEGIEHLEVVWPADPIVDAGVWYVEKDGWLHQFIRKIKKDFSQPKAFGEPYLLYLMPSGQYIVEDRELQLTHSFYVGQNEVTQKLWTDIMEDNPSYFTSCEGICPVERVSWYDAIEFANRLSRIHGLEACYERQGAEVTWPKGYECEGYRLPTEAEWEVVWGTFPTEEDDHIEQAWFIENSIGKPHAVCIKDPNSFGLCDISGNLAEWVWDRYQTDLPLGKDPLGADIGSQRIVRGGHWLSPNALIHEGHRTAYPPVTDQSMQIGLRLVRTALEE